MDNRNNNGPKPDPFGTPQVIGFCCELVFLTETNWYLLVKYERNQSLITLLSDNVQVFGSKYYDQQYQMP